MDRTRPEPDAQATPRGSLTWPNRVTLLRMSLIAPAVVCLLNLSEWGWARRTALALVVVMAAGDALDGYLARRLREATVLGAYLDPLADKLLIACCLVILAHDGTAVEGFVVPNWVPVIAIAKDVLTVTGAALLRAVTGRLHPRPRPLGKACTLVQLLTVIAVLSGPDLPDALARTVPVLWWAATIIAVAATADYLLTGNREVAPRGPA